MLLEPNLLVYQARTFSLSVAEVASRTKQLHPMSGDYQSSRFGCPLLPSACQTPLQTFAQPARAASLIHIYLPLTILKLLIE